MDLQKGRKMNLISKADLRLKIKEEKLILNLIDLQKMSNPIIAYMIGSKEYKKAESIYCYVSYNQEVVTHSFIRYSLLQGKKVAVPKIINGEMNFYYISDLNELKPGFWGISEPTTSNIAMDTNALIIMPGLAFDWKLNRVGYGKGYYDRYLEKNKNCEYKKIAFTYNFQLFNQINTNQYDVKIDQIITPTCIIKESGVIKNEYANRNW